MTRQMQIGAVIAAALILGAVWLYAKGRADGRAQIKSEIGQQIGEANEAVNDAVGTGAGPDWHDDSVLHND